MGLLCRDFKVLETSRSSDDGLDVVLLEQIEVSGCVEIAQDEFSCVLLGIGGQDDVIGFVLLLGIIIM